MNYRTLRTDELERLAYIGDQQAKLALASADMVPAGEAEQDAAEAQEDGEQVGYKNACGDIYFRFAEAIIAASNGNRDDDVCDGLKTLVDFLENNS